MGSGWAIRGGKIVAVTSGRIIAAHLRDTSWITKASRSQLQKKFKHAKVFGIKGNPNAKNLSAYQKALTEHVKSPDTKVIKGAYRGKSVMHYYNNKTGLNVIRDSNGRFVSGWKLNKEQAMHVLTKGKL